MFHVPTLGVQRSRHAATSFINSGMQALSPRTNVLHLSTLRISNVRHRAVLCGPISICQPQAFGQRKLPQFMMMHPLTLQLLRFGSAGAGLPASSPPWWGVGRRAVPPTLPSPLRYNVRDEKWHQSRVGTGPISVRVLW